MPHAILNDPAVLEDLSDRLHLLNQRIRILVTHSVDTCNGFPLHEVEVSAQAWADMLGGNETGIGRPAHLANGERAALMILRQLIDPAELAVVERAEIFWATPLGRALAWWVGGVQEYGDRGIDYVAVRRTSAAAVLGVSKQRLYELIKEGRFGTVSELAGNFMRAEALRDEMRRRYPLAD